MEELKRSILRDPLNRLIFSSQTGIFLVGGYIRDLLATGRRSRDLDYVVEGDVERLARGVGRDLDGTVVNLRKERIIRVSLSDGRTLDFSAMEGHILRDLKGRDFTVNAMAWSPATGIMDPFQGAHDIGKGRVRSILKKNFNEDPLRLLRAYRFAAQFSWYIARETRRQIRDLSPLVGQPASERITLEFFRLISSKDPEKALSMCLRDGVLQRIIPLTFKVLQRNIQLFSRIRKNLEKVPEINYLKYSLGHIDLSRLLRLEQLMQGAEHPSCRLSLSRDAAKRLETVNRMHGEFSRMETMSSAALYDLFTDAGESMLELLVLTDHVEFLPNMRRFQSVNARPLLSGHEVMKAASLEEGPRLGRTLYEMKRMQFQGLLKTRKDAQKWLREEGRRA
jgi:tRNA nucleotidyltransferase (CCA-adding enzyme)